MFITKCSMHAGFTHGKNLLHRPTCSGLALAYLKTVQNALCTAEIQVNDDDVYNDH